MEAENQATTEQKEIGQILEQGRQSAADVPADSQDHHRDQSDASGPDDTRHKTAPFAALHSERSRRKAAQQRVNELEAQLQEMQAAQTPAFEQPNQDVFWANPDRVLAETRRDTNLRISKAEFKADYGKAALDDLDRAVEDAAKKGHPDLPNLVIAMQQSDDPINVAREWAEQALGWSAPGGQQQSATPHYGMQFPSNLAGARNVGSRTGSNWSGPPSIADIIKSAGRPADIFKR